jgi:hypothetical protein
MIRDLFYNGGSMKLFYDGREWDTKSAKNSNELKLPTDKDTTCLKAFEV